MISKGLSFVSVMLAGLCHMAILIKTVVSYIAYNLLTLVKMAASHMLAYSDEVISRDGGKSHGCY